ncbi:MAG: hypothetical protein WD576_04300 [Nitriliruptoraceae bacterium]
MPKPSAMRSERDATIARVCVEVAPYHLDRPFDYLIPDDVQLQSGMRVEVVFNGRKTRGLVLDIGATSDVGAEQLRPVRRALGDFVWARPADIELFQWAAHRFANPLADVVRHALPPRVIDVERRAATAGWFPPVDAAAATVRSDGAGGASFEQWQPYGPAASALMSAVAATSGSFVWRPLATEQLADRLCELIDICLGGGRDAVVVVADSASPTARRIVDHFGAQVADLRATASSRIRYREWLRARCGQAHVVVGERAAAFAPVNTLGLAIVVDEANPAHKERRSPRHHAREVILERARQAHAVGLAVTTVPSATMWQLVRQRRVTPVTPDRSIEDQRRPAVRVVDWHDQPKARLAREAIRALRDAMKGNSYGVVLATRTGQGRMPVCSQCRTRIVCPECEWTLRLGAQNACESCGWTSPSLPACAVCGGTTATPLAAGTERLATEIAASVGGPIAVLEGHAPEVPPPPAVLVMTRGSLLDTPPGPVGAVVLPDYDAQLRRPSLDASQDALRTAMALAAWTTATATGSAAGSAPVIVQTTEPEHHAVVALRAWDPGGFWQHESTIREPFGFPPARYIIRVDADADERFGVELATAVAPGDDVIGPMLIDGVSRYLVKCDNRVATVGALRNHRIAWSRAGVDVRVDVDPVDP